MKRSNRIESNQFNPASRTHTYASLTDLVRRINGRPLPRAGIGVGNDREGRGPLPVRTPPKQAVADVHPLSWGGGR
jgi:hypothetical protein